MARSRLGFAASGAGIECLSRRTLVRLVIYSILPDGCHGTLGSLSTCHANAIGVAAVRSRAGSSVDHDCTLSWKTAVALLNWANASTPSAGQVRMPLTTPVAAKELGPSTAAPA